MIGSPEKVYPKPADMLKQVTVPKPPPGILNKPRIASIDLLKGIVMILMALDHVRDFFHYDAFFFEPTDLAETNTALFFTRFVTHFCAPVFVFLAGTSAFFVGQRLSKKELSKWLLKRGIWLIILEITVIKFAWNFKLDYSTVALQVIWLLGAAMIFLAVFIHVPKKVMILTSLFVIFLHNALDGYIPDKWNSLWTILHVQAPIITDFSTFFIAYPLVPWIFVMPLGYYFGLLYQQNYDPGLRRKSLRYLGMFMILLFILMRAINLYGDLTPWSARETVGFTLLSFLNVTKYPPSLHFLLVTLGPAILLLSFAEKWKGKVADALVTIGKVPMFFYIIHLYVIHFFALIAVVALGLSPKTMVIDLFVTLTPELQGYGFSLLMVYIIWILLVLLLYPLCTWYWNYKKNNRHKWWLSYL